MNIMNTKLKIASLAVIAGLYSTGATAETGSGTAQATVVEPIVIDTFVVMDFTNIASGTLGGNLVMDDAGAITPDSDASVIGGGGGTALGFTVTAEPALLVAVTIGDGTLSNGTPADDMTLTMDQIANYNVDATGSDVHTVGGSLAVAATQTAGSYSSAILVTVNYQ